MEAVKQVFSYLLIFFAPLLVVLAVNVYLYLLDVLLGKPGRPFLQQTRRGLEKIGRHYFPKSKVTKTYTARVLVQHQLAPETNDYSSFSELVVLGKLAVPAATDFSTAFFDGNQNLIDQVAQHIRPRLEDSYPNANGQVLTTKLINICQLDDCLDRVTFEGDFLEVSERLYTFTRMVSLDEFLAAYNIGKDVDDD